MTNKDSFISLSLPQLMWFILVYDLEGHSARPGRAHQLVHLVRLEDDDGGVCQEGPRGESGGTQGEARPGSGLHTNPLGELPSNDTPPWTRGLSTRPPPCHHHELRCVPELGSPVMEQL